MKGFGFQNGVGNLRFIDLLTHRSGVEQSIAKYINTDPDFTATGFSINNYDGLRALVANGIAADWKETGCAQKQNDGTYLPGNPANSGSYFSVYCYKNANYGLLRILAAVLWNKAENVTVLPMDKGVSAWLYVAYVYQRVWGPIDVNAQCYAPNQNAKPEYFDSRYPTAMPVTSWGNVSVFETCGHWGWHLSAIDLAKFMAYIRRGEQLNGPQQILSPASRDLMDQYKMGWSSNSNRGANAGIYWHAGDLMAETNAVAPVWINGQQVWQPVKASREAHSCVMKFPDGIEASLVYNSNLRGGPVFNAALYAKGPCTVLLDSYKASQQTSGPVQG